MVNPILALIVVLLVFIILNTIKPLLADIFIFVWFLFSIPNIEGSLLTATFYGLASIFIIVIRLSKPTFILESETINKIGKTSLAGKIPFIGVGLGIAIFFIMRLLQGVSATAIIGVPSLGISGQTAAVTTVMLLGIVETRFFFIIYNIFKENKGIFLKVPILSQFLGMILVVLPIIMTATLFAVFHLSAYSLNISTLVFAGLVMVIWIISFVITKSDLPASVSHALWNGVVSLARVLGIAI